jgi:hypothetical protein
MKRILAFSQEPSVKASTINIVVAEFEARGVSQVESLTISDFH